MKILKPSERKNNSVHMAEKYYLKEQWIFPRMGKKRIKDRVDVLKPLPVEKSSGCRVMGPTAEAI